MWPDARIDIESNVDLTISQEKMPERTLLFRARDWDAPDVDTLATCLVVQTGEEGGDVNIETKISRNA